MNNSNSNNLTGGRRAVRSLSSIVDFAVLLIFGFLLIFAGYSLWDAHEVYQAGDSSQYEMYKPTVESTLSFDELRAMNPDVFGWITVYDTKIDYPLVKPKTSNNDYLSRNVKGEIDAPGSIFLDYRNHEDFSDFNTIIFGHHMAERAMFGDLDLFLEQQFFDTHQYGNLFYGGQNHGVEFFAMLQADAYDSEIYSAGIFDEALKQNYLNHLYETARFTRSTTVTPQDHIILLSTCSADITNGRFILVGKILDHEVANPFPEESKKEAQTGRFDIFNVWNSFMKLPILLWILILLVLIVLTYLAYRGSRRHDEKRSERAQSSPKNR